MQISALFESMLVDEVQQCGILNTLNQFLALVLRAQPGRQDRLQDASHATNLSSSPSNIVRTYGHVSTALCGRKCVLCRVVQSTTVEISRTHQR